MAIFLSNKNTAGTQMGHDATEKLGFYGTTPIVQNVALTACTAGATVGEVTTVLNTVITFLKTIGLTA